MMRIPNTLAGFPQAPVLLAEGAQVCAVAAPWRKWRGFWPAKRSNTWQYYMKKLNTENKTWIEMYHPLGPKVSLMFDQHSWILTLQDLSHKNAVPWLECLHSLVRGCLPKATSKNTGSFHEKRAICLTRLFPVFPISIVPHTFPASTHQF